MAPILCASSSGGTVQFIVFTLGGVGLRKPGPWPVNFLEQQGYGVEFRIFFLFDLLVKVAFLAGGELFRKGALRLAVAEGPGNDPAGAAGVLAVVNTIESFLHGGRTDP